MLGNAYAQIQPRATRPAPRADFATFAAGHRALLAHEAVRQSSKERRLVEVALAWR
jgi:hypothetical protein